MYFLLYKSKQIPAKIQIPFFPGQSFFRVDVKLSEELRNAEDKEELVFDTSELSAE